MEINIVARFNAIDVPLKTLKKELQDDVSKTSLFQGGLLKSVLDEIKTNVSHFFAPHEQEVLMRLSEKTGNECSGEDLLNAIHLVEKQYQLI